MFAGRHRVIPKNAVQQWRMDWSRRHVNAILLLNISHNCGGGDAVFCDACTKDSPP